MIKQQTKASVAQDVIFLLFGILSASIGLKSFLVPNHFLDGGITGLSLLVSEMLGWHLGLLLLIFNLPFIIIGYKLAGKMFALRTTIAVIGVAICLQYLQYPQLTHDKLLVAVFGGFFVGLGIGLSMRGGGTFDGIEVLALFTLKRTGFSITEIILGFDIIIFIIAGFYLNIETALYAMLTYFVASQTTKYVIDGIEAYTGVTIISGESEAIKAFLVLKMNKGITVYKGERGFMKDSYEQSKECDVVFTVITRLEVRRLKKAIYQIDPTAFVFTHTIKETSGGLVKKIVKH
ncbi:MAG: YitT family protein [Ferruginibacter sp.]|nr:YitT family protein [Ferruginibacter sp.]